MVNLIFLSVVFGSGLAIDLFILTIASFNDKKMSFLNWTIPLVFTHITFPLASLFLLWMFKDLNINFYLGIIGFIGIAVFLYLEFLEILEEDSEEETNKSQFWKILAVSWDALLCGPAYVNLTENWTTSETIISVIIFGSIVLITSTVALFLTKILIKKLEEKEKDGDLKTFEFIGNWLIFSVIGSFGLMSLWHAFFENGEMYWFLPFSTLIFALVFYSIRDLVFKKPNLKK